MDILSPISDNMSIIITSPHSLCKPSKERTCDLAAKRAATSICSILQLKHQKWLYFPSIELREQHDLNRSSSRSTQYRTTVRNVMKSTSPGTLLLDIHSFPNEYLDEAGDINFFKKGEKPPEFVIMEGSNDVFHGTKLSQLLCNNLKRLGVDCKIVSGVKVLDILNEAAEFKICGVLLEFNEDLQQKRMDLICSWIIDSIMN